MLYIIGVGLKPEHLSIEAIEALKECQEIFFEKYTSDFPEGSIKEIETLCGKKITELDRKKVEENFDFEKAKNKNIALLAIGNPFFATTHVQILLDAKEKGIEFKTIPGISIQDFIGKTGLNAYRFGKTTSIVFRQPNYCPESFYDSILSNSSNGLHSLCLLDITPEKKMNPREALELLLAIEKKRKKTIIGKTTIVVMAAMGSSKEKIAFGKAKTLKEKEFPLPAALIVCAKLSEKELEALKALAEEIK
ncbi:MAG: diphthine synthase [Candidatus Diapherotrites archaeon]